MLSSAVTIGLIPNGSAQQYTTSTSFLTSAMTHTTSASYVASYYTTTSTGITTQTKTVNLSGSESGSECYNIVVFFNSTGTTHITYSANEAMTIYVIDGVKLMALTFLILSGRSQYTTASYCDPNTLSQIAYGQPISISGPTSGSFDEYFEPTVGYGFLIEAPLSDVNPAVTLTYGPVLASSTTTSEIFALTSWSITATSTLTFVTSLEVPFTQTYGSWIVVIILAVVISVGVWAVSGRKRKT